MNYENDVFLGHLIDTFKADTLLVSSPLWITLKSMKSFHALILIHHLICTFRPMQGSGFTWMMPKSFTAVVFIEYDRWIAQKKKQVGISSKPRFGNHCSHKMLPVIWIKSAVSSKFCLIFKKKKFKFLRKNFEFWILSWIWVIPI